MSAAQSSNFSITNPPSPEQFGGAKRIDVRPRLPGARPSGNEPSDDSAMLHFSCPACLTMLSASRGQAVAAVTCGNCTASVRPPQLVSASAAPAPGKTMLPPPQKNGMPALKH